MGVPYVPVLGLVGTDILKRRDDMTVAVDPFDGRTLTVVAKAMLPDVAVFHAHKADRQGNVSCGYDAEVVLLAEASAHVIVTAETIVERLTEKEATGAFIPAIHVDAAVRALRELDMNAVHAVVPDDKGWVHLARLEKDPGF